MIQTTAVAFGVLVTGALVFLLVGYFRWRSVRIEALRAGREIAETDAGPIEYVLRGDAGPVLLFLHGVLGGYDQAPTAAPAGYRLLALSRPGYLSTPIEAGRTPAEQARAYAALLDSLGIEKVVVLGASAGGPSAIAFAAMYPDRTLALVALEAISRSYPNEGELPGFIKSDFLYWLVVGAAMRVRGLEGLVSAQVPDARNRQRILSDPRKRAEFRRLMWSMWPFSLRSEGWRNDMLQVKDLSLPLDEVTAPTLILHGTADTVVPFTHSERLADEIAEARLFAIEGGDHMMPISHKEEVDRAIMEFVRSTGALPA